MSTDRLSPFRRCLSAGLVTGLAASAVVLPTPARAANPDEVSMLILRENGVGSASTAQKYIDVLMQTIARVNGWGSAVGTYHTRRASAESFIAQAKPSYGFFSLGAYLGMRAKYDLTPVGKATVAGGGEQYYVVSKTAATLDECKGKTLASNHAADTRFVDKVVFGKDANLSDFEVVATRRPLQTLKKVTRDEAVCALVDDAQLGELNGMAGADGVKPVWFSSKLPSVVIVAFPGVDAKGFGAKLDRVCQGQGKSACDKAGIRSLKKAKTKDFASLQAAYDK